MSELCDSVTILNHGQLVLSEDAKSLAARMNVNAPLEVRIAEGSGGEAVEAVVAR